MSKTKELSISSTLWVDVVEVVDLKKVVLDKIKVQISGEDNNEFKDYVIEYNGGGFWLSISELKGYFRIINSVGYLNLLFSDKQEAMYDKIWQKIVNDAGNSNGLVKDSKTIKLYSDALPVNREFWINKITIAIRSGVGWRNVFYPQISLNYCSYDV